MDLVTQGIMGAAMASAAAPAREVRRAALVGLGAGLLPDADALIRSAEDPLLVLEYHRHFTHALVMVPVIALVAAALFWLLLRRGMPFGRIYAYALLGASLAGVLDACTSYGTHLWWPFAEEPVAWRIISIFDPVFMLLLAVPLGIGLVRRRRGPVRWGLALAAGYLLLGVVQHERAEAVACDLARQRGHAVDGLIVKPTIGNLVLWRALTVAGGRVYADAVRVGVWKSQVYAGTSALLYNPEEALQKDWVTLAVRRDVDRFMRFADSLVVRHPERPAFIGDARFSMLPTSVAPMWGLVLDPAASPPVRYVTDRSLSPEGRRRFLDMLRGRPLEKDKAEAP